jgi:glutamate dehydrogenase
MDANLMHSEFSQSLQKAADDVWARFTETMPARYFRETDRETQLSHLHVLTACLATGLDQDLMIRSQNGDTYTFLTGRSYPGQLGQMLDRLPKSRSLTSARAYTSKDGRWVLDIFELGERTSRGIDEEEFATLAEKLSEGHSADIQAEYETHLRGCSPEYLRAVPVRIAQVHFELIRQAKETGEVVVEWEDINSELDTVRLAVEGTQAKTYFQRLAHYLGHNGIDIERAYVTSFGDETSPYRYLGFTVRGADAHPKSKLSDDLKRLYYLDDSALELWSTMEGWSLGDSEVVDFLVSLVHQILSPTDPVKYARPRLVQAALKHPQHLLRYVHRFRYGGHEPPEDFEGLDRDEERDFFRVCAQVLESTIHHNLEQKSRQALGARLHPGIFREDPDERPYAVLFARGRDHLGFHVRFQDVARGGMRLVCPRSIEAHNAETERLFDEAYSLAQAQHLKNKDIPEGGAKAAVLVLPGSDPTFAGKCFANTLLDLTVGMQTSGSHHGCARREQPDLIYLGPDENVSTQLIEWIAQRAALRGHPLPSAFMSSKPGAGINHKEFGITSEGVTVFLEESLRQAGIDPNTDPFTVKITGGPDGDVAGNEIRILLTKYPNTAKIVGIGDGSGVAEDPRGLHPGELIRLFENVLPIARFDPSKLSAQGRVVSVDEPGGVELRNTLHNRLQSDAFVPAGGRPATINSHNWREFFTADGKPSSRMIVEGANLFLTEKARRELSSVGVSIIKDSSANKCGVICSSFEVLASMLLTESEFLEHKATFVAQVIDRLRELARAEATLLFREHRRRPDLSLPVLSVRLSKVMLKTAEAVAEASVDPLEDSLGGTREVFEAYLPPLLREVAGDRLHKVPVDYRQRIVACSLSGKIVYREGITYLEDLPQEALCDLALTYLKGEKVVRGLIDEVKASGLASSKQLAELLELGGARTLAQSSVLGI